jgi:hypothetical protein
MSNLLVLPDNKRNLRSLIDLSPTEFENLTFDLVVAMGLKNVAWRTPGADGGRDIEATAPVKDFSGKHTSQKWFIECKRYSGSVDWPTIYGKLAYADSHVADYLLMCTSSQFTPAAITHADEWNNQRRNTKIRLWPSHVLEQQLLSHPDIQLKYGLTNTPGSPGQTIVNLALVLSKTVATHYSNLVFSDVEPDRMLEASRCISELITQRMTDLAEKAKIALVLKPNENDASATYVGKSFEIDHYGFQALNMYLFALSKRPLTFVGVSDHSCKAEITPEHLELLERYSHVFDAIATWGDFELQTHANFITISQRVDPV